MELIHFPKPEPRTAADLLDGFLLDLSASGASSNTVRAYRLDLERFARWYQEPLYQLKAQDLVRYFNLLEKKGLAKSSQARHRASISEFLAWCDRNDVIVANPMGKLRPFQTEERLPRPIPPDAMKALTQAMRRLPLRERTLFFLLKETGMRVGEALQLDWEDVNLSPGQEQLRILGKGNKERVVPLLFGQECLNLLRALQREDNLTTGAVFRAGKHKERRLHYNSVRYHWEKLLEKAGLSGYTIHQLRHTYATELVAKGMGLGMVRRLMGHAKIQTTELYTKVEISQLRDELRKAMKNR